MHKAPSNARKHANRSHGPPSAVLTSCTSWPVSSLPRRSRYRTLHVRTSPTLYSGTTVSKRLLTRPLYEVYVRFFIPYYCVAYSIMAPKKQHTLKRRSQVVLTKAHLTPCLQRVLLAARAPWLYIHMCSCVGCCRLAFPPLPVSRPAMPL